MVTTGPRGRDSGRSRAGQLHSWRWALAAIVGLLVVGLGLALWWRSRPESPGGAVTIADVEDDEPTALNPGYVGPQACAACHAKRVAEFQTTSHFQTSRLPQSAMMPPGFEPGRGAHTPRDPSLRFEMTRSDGNFFQTVIQAAPTGERRTSSPIDLVYGARHADEVYFTWHGDRLYQLPMVWLYPQKQWANISYNRYGTGDLSREGTTRCLECHTTWFGHVAGTPNQYRRDSFILGVTCERCHGPGREHVAFHEANPGADSGRLVVHPGRLSRERRLEVCTQCHSNATHRRGSVFSYRPGEPLEGSFRTTASKHPEHDHVANQIQYLRQSKCFQKSDTLTCTTCHDPHRPHGSTPSRSSQHACLECHKPADCGEQDRLPVAVRGNCVGCHMPRRVWMNVHFHSETEPYVPPATRHEHRIAVHPEARQEVLRMWRLVQSDDHSRQETVRLAESLVGYWLAQAEGYRREYRFLAEIGAVRQALRVDPTPAVRKRLEEVVAIQTKLEDDLVEVQHLIDGQRHKEAVELLQKIMAVKPDMATAHGKLGTCYAILGQNDLAVKHLQEAAQLDPNDPYGHSMIGWLAFLQDRPGDAVAAYLLAEEIEPQNAKIHYHMGLALAKLGRLPEAVERFRRLLTIDPNHAGGCQSLSHLLREQGQTAEALRDARRAARLTHYQNPDVLVTLAETYVDAGRFADAEETAARALAAAEAGNPKRVLPIRQRLEELRARAERSRK